MLTSAFNGADQGCFTALSNRMDGFANGTMEEVLARVKKTKTSTTFLKFVDDRTRTDDTWKLWHQFVFSDCYAYISLYLGIRSGNWKLRMSGLKLMTPLFTAYDRPCYSRIIPHHFAYYQLYIRKNLEDGSFTVSVCGKSGRSVALDEAHEMTINKDMKTAFVTPTSSYLQKSVHYLR